jgi:hypothetical protein
VNRTRVWLVVSPVVAAGVLIAHSVAYRLTSTPTDPFHAYLGHAPQVLLLLAIAGIVVAALGRPRSAPPAHVFPVVALATYVVQEHVERIVHGGVPLLLTSPAFLVGLALQVPVALVAWGLARWLLRAVGEQRRPARLRPRLEFRFVDFCQDHVAALGLPSPSSRAPPTPLLSR